MDTKVKKYFEKQEDSKRNICLRLREIILSTFPGISEELKWGVPVYGGGKIYIGEVRLGVNLGFSMEGLTEKEMENFSGKGKMMRHIKIMNPDEIEKEKIVRLLKLIK